VTGIRIDTAGRAVHVILDRPEQGNALDLATLTSLLEAFRQVQALTEDSGVRAVILRAEGPRFCVGGDLATFLSAPVGSAHNEILARPIHEVIELIAELPIPVIASVHGATGGGGVGLVLACDLAIASEEAFFRLGYTGSGLSPDSGTTWELPRRAGIAIAADLMLTNRRVPATEALGLGMVSRVVPAEQLGPEIAGIIEAIEFVPPATVAETKRLLRAAAGRGRSQQLNDEAATIGRIGDTADTREAIDAFLNHRAPVFKSTQ
jgi:2-(1,2-epoxy-1,2-dihydrophenyl)acetyl-CoA isomerase